MAGSAHDDRKKTHYADGPRLLDVCVQHSACHYAAMLCSDMLCSAILHETLLNANMLLHTVVQYTLVVQGLAIAIKGQRAAQGLSGTHWRCAFSAV